MLVPATAEDLKKFAEITIKKKDEENKEANKENLPDNSNQPATETSTTVAPGPNNKKGTGQAVATLYFNVGIQGGATIQISIPVVATIIQRRRNGAVHMDIESPGPRREGHEDNFVFTTSDEEFKQGEMWPDTRVKSEEAEVTSSVSPQGQAVQENRNGDLQFFQIVDDDKGKARRDLGQYL